MTFDNGRHEDAELGLPILHHPKAVLTEHTFEHALKAAYFYALNHGRTIIQQHYGAYSFRLQSANTPNIAFAESDFVRIAEGFRYIHDETTHLVGVALFSVLQANDRASAYHR